MTADTRTRAQKLAAMAAADESPFEAEIAQAKLAEMGAGSGTPPRRPSLAGAGGVGDAWGRGFSSTLSSFGNGSTSPTSTASHFHVEFRTNP